MLVLYSVQLHRASDQFVLNVDTRPGSSLPKSPETSKPLSPDSLNGANGMSDIDCITRGARVSERE